MKLNDQMIREIISSNPETAMHLKKANNNAMVAKVLFVPAIALILIPPIIYVISDKVAEYNYNPQTLFNLGLLGGGLLFVAIPFAISAGVHKKKAIGIYNSELTSLESNKINFELGLTQNGIGL